MKKVNLKGKLNLKKETMSKMDMNEVNGGATIYCTTASLLVICNNLTLFCPSKNVVCASATCPSGFCPTGGSLVC
jgi:hypothetical protein